MAKTTKQVARASLDALLKRAGSRARARDVRALLAGVAAAPGADGGNGPADGWFELVKWNIGVRPTGALESALRELHGEAVAAVDAAISPAADRRRPLATLRGELKRRKLDGFVVPLADEHQSEYPAKRARRLAWLTGFTGSAGLAIVLANRAAIFVDGRYTLQARAQVDGKLFERHHIADSPPAAWIERHLKRGVKLGYDPWLHTVDGAGRLQAACAGAGAELVAVRNNPIDAVWRGQPAQPLAAVTRHGASYAGRSAKAKLMALSKTLKAAHQGAVVLTAPDSIAWLLNLRGGDVPYTPLALCFAIVHADAKVELFIDPRKLAPGTAKGLGKAVTVRAADELVAALDRLGKRKTTVRLDFAGASHAIHGRLVKAGAVPVRGDDLCVLPKAKKNRVELDGMRAAHRRDGAALTRFLAWLDGAARRGKLTEIGAAGKLEALRRENEKIQGLSFPTISGAGRNGAIVHYRVNEKTDRRLEPGSLYLVDSGAQYLDGTTDVTRTVAIGRPSAEMRDRFTRVLKGHIAIATARFPEGTTGTQLDALARMHLWDAGLDYDHGTGHGVGSYLCVHEGPQRISKGIASAPLAPGMIVSNEPGYYKTGAYGIRIENLVAVQPRPGPDGAERRLLGFETLTLAPIDLRLVDKGLMTRPEIAWLDSYHALVRKRLNPMLDARTRKWLSRATRSMGRG